MEFPKSRILSAKRLAQLVKESNANGDRFCFILGSGASVESDIPSGNELEMRWMDCIMGKADDRGTPAMDADETRSIAETLYDEEKLEHSFKEIEEAWLKAKKKNRSIPSEYYFDIYKLRFHPNPHNGYSYLEKIMESCEPSLGYHILAKLLTDENLNNLVITTNFDSLVEDALFLYTDKKPLVISHESLADYMEANIQRPIIAKVHRGLMYAPFNSSEATSELKEEWRKALNDAFKTYTPIVIGYAGGDRSLMAYLAEKTTVMRNGLYWCYLGDYSLPEESIQEFVNNKGGCFVSIKGFDALMIAIGEILYKDEITPSGTKAYLEKQCAKRVQKYNEKWDELNEKPELKEILQPMNEAEQREEEKRAKKNELTARDYMRRGKRAFEERRYQDAIEEYTNAINMSHNHAVAYYHRGYTYYNLGQYKEAVYDYTQAIKLNPNLGTAYNFASLYQHRGDAYYALGDNNKSIDDFTKAIELHSKYTPAYLGRAKAYRAIGEDVLAEADEKIAEECGI